MKKLRKKEEAICCDEETMTCDTCSFEDSIDVDEE